jgi:uncharacterized protein (DUF302 family)
MTMDPHEISRWTSRADVAATVRAITQKLEGAGVTVFAVIDQQAFAREVGMEMVPLTEILFGNPRAGTPLMQADPLAAFDLPLKAIVMRRDDGPVEVLMLTAQAFAARYGSAEIAEKVFGNSAGLIAAAIATLDP